MQRSRRQLILVHRQITDDAPLLFGSLALTTVLLCVLGILAFVYPHDFLLHVFSVLFVLPFLVAVGLFLLGAIQARGEEGDDVAGVLRVQSSEIILARVVTGVAFVVVIVCALAISVSGAVIAGLLQWPESLIRMGLVDLSITMLLTGLACYLLGFLARLRTGNLVASLCLLPLSSAFTSLFIIKGLGGQLGTVLALYIAVLLVCVFVSSEWPRLAIIASGVACLTLFVVPLYWLRYASCVMTALATLETASDVTVTAHHDFRPSNASESRLGNFTVRGEIESGGFPIRYGDLHFLLRPMGIMHYLQTREPSGRLIDISHFGDFEGLSYNQPGGLFVYTKPRDTWLLRRPIRDTRYIGPEGIEEAPLESMGRFQSPVTCTKTLNGAVIFDHGTRRFYDIHIKGWDVDSGPSLEDPSFQPIEEAASKASGGACSLRCFYSSVPYDQDAPYVQDRNAIYVPIVAASGAILVLDRAARRLITGAGYLPDPKTFLGGDLSKPRDLLDYKVEAIVKCPENEYAGLMTSSLSRQGTRMAVALFDRDGRIVEERGGGGSVPVALRTPTYLVESLHPPVLTLASFFTAYTFDAGATHRALFLMPNSFVALQRDRETSGFLQFLWALLFLVPAVALSGFLSWRVVRDASMIGLTRRAQGVWLAGTLAFGLPAYITYRLTWPRVVMKPCANCGRARRIDRDLCHHCGRAWEVPELDPPAWRITDAQTIQGNAVV